MTVLSYLWAFVLLLSVLVFVHELGHFLVARACGVRVLKFSIGFGPPIGFGRYRLAWTRGGTEYVVAWFPLGGFVKMLGENPEEAGDAPVDVRPGESLPEKNTWQKLAIVFAGPAANLILPVLVFAVTLAIGLPRPANIVGGVEPGSPAARAGLQPGDRILSVDGESIGWWDELDTLLRARVGETLVVDYERDGEAAQTRLVIDERARIDDFGQVTPIGWAGLEHARPTAMLGVPSADSPAAAAGLHSGDVVESVDDQPVEDWAGFRRAYEAAAGGEVELVLRRGEGEAAVRSRLAVPALGSVEALGVLPANVLVATVGEGSAAERAGLRAGDLIVAVDGAPVGSFGSFAEIVRTSGGRPIAIQYARDGVIHDASVEPDLVDYDAGFGLKELRYLVGITGEPSLVAGASGIDRERNPIVAVPRAVAMTVEVTHVFLRGLAKLVTGEVSRKQLAGPIGIAEIAGTAYAQGWESFLRMLVLISINLGILNLLPIPVLDGGQAVIYTVEGIRRAPLSLRTREIVQQVGLTVLMLLMGLAFWNDLSRQWTRLVDWLSGA